MPVSCCNNCGNNALGDNAVPPGEAPIKDERLVRAGESDRLDAAVRLLNIDSKFDEEGEGRDADGGVPPVTMETGVVTVFVVMVFLSIRDSSVGVLPGDISMSSACRESENNSGS